MDLVNILEMLINFNTGSLNVLARRVEISPKQARRDYLTTWFLMDAFMAIPWDLILMIAMYATDGLVHPTSGLYAGRAFRVTKLVRLGKVLDVGNLKRYTKRMMRSFGRKLAGRNKLIFGFDVLAFLITMMVMAHWMACLQVGDALSFLFTNSSTVHRPNDRRLSRRIMGRSR